MSVCLIDLLESLTVLDNTEIGEVSYVQKLYSTQYTNKRLLVLRSVRKWLVIVNLDTIITKLVINSL